MKIDAVISRTIASIVDKLNNLKVERQNVINVFQNKEGYYIAIFYS